MTNLLLALPKEKIPVVVAIFTIAAVHYFLAIFSVVRLLKFKAKLLPTAVWHFVIQLGVIVGPLFFLALHARKNTPRFDIEQMILQKKQKENESSQTENKTDE